MKTSELRVTGLCSGNSPEASEFPAQRDSNAENVSVWWCHHEYSLSIENWTESNYLVFIVLYIKMEYS